MHNNPINSTDPLGLISNLSRVNVGVAAAGIAGGLVQTVGGLAVAVGSPLTGPATPLTLAGGIAFAADGAYAIAANTVNLSAALHDQSTPLKGSILTDAANAVFPNSATAQIVAGGIDFAKGFLAGGIKDIADVATASVRVQQIINGTDKTLLASGSASTGINAGGEVGGAGSSNGNGGNGGGNGNGGGGSKNGPNGGPNGGPNSGSRNGAPGNGYKPGKPGKPGNGPHCS